MRAASQRERINASKSEELNLEHFFFLTQIAGKIDLEYSTLGVVFI